MNINGWKYYNHAAIPTIAAHQEPDLSSLTDKSMWRKDGSKTPLFARWTSDFDCEAETNWWYIIKDTPFDISTLKAKRRYEINKGKKNFDVKEIDYLSYCERLFEITKSAYSGWSEKYRPNIEKESFIASVNKWNWYKVYGVFLRCDDTLCGYALLSKQDRCVEFNVLRIAPEYERLGANAAAVAAVVENHNEFIADGGYICDGARSIRHETAFQDYLEKYFGFRKAYCKLHIEYNPKIKWLIKFLYPFRKLLFKCDKISQLHQINGVLSMEELVRNQT